MDFETLYARHAADVYRFAVYLSGDRVLAEDIVSETFVRVWGARERIEIPTVRGYLLAIARNVFLKGLARKRRETAIEAAHPDPAPRADVVHEQRRELEQVLEALRTLPEVDRAALILRAEEGLSYEEIATLLQITPVAARVKVHRARTKLAASRKDLNR